MNLETELDKLYSDVLKSEASQSAITHYYATLLKMPLYLVIEGNSEYASCDNGNNDDSNRNNDVDTISNHHIANINDDISDGNDFMPLFVEHENHYFIMAFDTLDRLQDWADDHFNQIAIKKIKGIDLINGIGDQVFLCLNYGIFSYKQFSPEELARLKTMAAKIAEMGKTSNNQV